MKCAHVKFLFYLFLGSTKEKIHESDTVEDTTEEKLFNALFDPIKECVDERKMESKLNYFHQRLDTQDPVVVGRIGDVENNYQLLDLGMHSLLSIYCAKGKYFDQVFSKKEMKDLGFHRFLRIKFLHYWKFEEMLSQTILQMTKLKGSGPHIEAFQNPMLLAQRYVIFLCNMFQKII